MCGLIGWISKNKSVQPERVKSYIIDQYEEQFSRGVKGFGIIEIDNKGYIDVLRATEPTKMMVDLHFSKVRHMFLHHRQPTSSMNTLDQTHPLEIIHFNDLKYRWLVMHNGIINNCDKLKEEHEKLGYEYLTAYKEYAYHAEYATEKFNDSESFAIELARFLEKKTDLIAAKGSFAFIAIATGMDMKVHEIYLGTNTGYNLNISDKSYGFAFASEEKTGEPIKKDQITVFKPRFLEENLEGFDKLPKTIEMKYTPEEIKYEHKDHYSWKQPIGFKSKKEAPADAPNKEIKHFTSFGDMFEFISNGPLGNVYKKSTDHVAITEFPSMEFKNLIVAGKIEEAENVYNTYLDGFYSWFDMADVMEEVFEPVAVKLSDNPTVAEIIDSSNSTTGLRMKDIAEQYLPVFRLCAFCECIITLGYQYQIELCNKNTKALTISKKIDQADPDKTLDEQMDKDISGLWPGQKNKEEDTSWITNPDKKEEDIHVVSDTIEGIESDADAGLDALTKMADKMDPDEVLSEAGSVGDAIRIAAETAICDQLRKIETIAAENGLEISIPFHIGEITEHVRKTSRRFETLAKIVRTALNIEEYEEETNNRGYLNG